MTLLCGLSIGFSIGIALGLWLIVMASSSVFVPDLIYEDEEENSMMKHFVVVPVHCEDRTEMFVLIFGDDDAKHAEEVFNQWADDPDLPFNQDHARRMTELVNNQLKGV